ncbi:MAG: hypothetical protein WBA40_01680, partial [Roseiarcus sp.]
RAGGSERRLSGTAASQLWFIAFALTEAAPVRTLALIEAPMAQSCRSRCSASRRACVRGWA